MRRPRTPTTTSAPEPTRTRIYVVFAGMRARQTEALKPVRWFYYYITDERWRETQADLDSWHSFTFARPLSPSETVGAVLSYEGRVTESGKSITWAKSSRRYEGTIGNVETVTQWQALHRAAEVMIHGWKVQDKGRRDLIREHVRPLRDAMNGMTHAERKAFIGHIWYELLNGFTG